jgi:Pyridine nucleotide-disulphide oxidoreductase
LIESIDRRCIDQYGNIRWLEEEMTTQFPVAIFGAGPVGLAAAAHLVTRGLIPLVLERGPSVGHAMQAWGHVRVFSPWSYNVDTAARVLLELTGWVEPNRDALPTGREIVERYLRPLAGHPKISPNIILDAEVVSVAREDLDKATTAGRGAAPFVITYRNSQGRERRVRAQAVIDASGTWFTPNPMGIDGWCVDGERAASDRIAYGIPNVLNGSRSIYAGSRVLVVGGGHSATNVVLDLLTLQETSPETRVSWALRHDRIHKLVGGGLNDKLPARGALGRAAQRAIEAKRLQLLAPFSAERVASSGNVLQVTAKLAGQPYEIEVDRIVVATGFRPNNDMLREIRVGLDPILEAPPALAPLIDPNVHSCGTVPPHGAMELSHPETGFYIVGSKSYGRAPTFLMVTGYEQVRSVVAEIAGDHDSARNVQLVLPETGVCSTIPATSQAAALGCCGGPPAKGVEACCADDAVAKAAGNAGCGCNAPVATRARSRAGDRTSDCA